MRIANINLIKNINFQSGKTKIYSDFDGTFMPKEYNHDIICNENSKLDKAQFKAYFDSFGKFLNQNNKQDKDVSLTITTGRNLHEFNYFMTKIREKGLEIPVPDSLIIINGGDEYLKSKDNFFKSEDKEMFEENKTNENKANLLKKYIISWDIGKIKEIIKDFIDKFKEQPKLIEPATHQGLYGYKEGLSLQENIEDDNSNTNYVSLRKDGSYQIRLTAPIGSKYIEEFKKLDDILSKDGYAFDFNVSEHDGETFVNTIENPDKWELGTSINIKPKTKGKIQTLNKYHHVKLMVDEIQKNNSCDLVIACGDGSNDLTMLDLSNYIDGMEDSNDFPKEEFREQVQKLPLISIFVNNSSNNEKIYQFEKCFNFDNVKRFIIVDKNDPKRPHTLLEAIKLAQEEYSKQNINYRKHN